LNQADSLLHQFSVPGGGFVKSALVYFDQAVANPMGNAERIVAVTSESQPIFSRLALNHDFGCVIGCARRAIINLRRQLTQG